MILELERYAYTPTHVEGVLRCGDWDCYTLELPWLDNRVGRSCIPEGRYRVRRGKHNATGKPALELLDVPGRTLIKVHAANVPSELRGCIAPGLMFGAIDGQRAVLRSGAALADLLSRVGDVTEIVIRSQLERYSPRDR